MPIENIGITQLPVKQQYVSPDAEDPIVFPGEGVVARIGQRVTPPAESLVRTVRTHLECVLHSPHFDGSARSREFLRYVVDEVLAGRAAYLKQAAIAVEVFGRKPDFDAVIDPIVRVQAGRLRRSLERFYLLSGETRSIRIELPKGSYAPVFVETVEMPKPRVARTEGAQEWPTVVIHPFTQETSGADACSAQLRKELSAELCRYGIVRVSHPGDANRPDSPAFAARFELHGSVRAAEGEQQIAARLVDRHSGQQVWADEFHTASRRERWSGSAAEIGRVIAARVGAEHGVITRLLAGEHAARGFSAAGSFAAIARSQHFMYSRQVAAFVPAVEALQDLTQRAPEIELAWTSLARLYLMNHSFELSSMFTPVEMAIGCANQSVLLEPASARARCLMANALLVKGELSAARRELDLALRHNGDSLAYREVAGWLLALTGDWEQGVALMRAATERNPFCQPCVSHGLWADAMRRNDYEGAYSAALEYREPNFFWRELMLASCLGHLGRLEDASACATELLRAKPQFAYRGRRLIAHFIKSDELRATIVDGLRAAGIEVA